MFKPLLAATVKDLDTITYPVYASVKLDGVRAIAKDGEIRSRSNKPIANKRVQELLSAVNTLGLDGELIVGNACSEDCFRHTTSVVTSHDADVKGLRFFVFDVINEKDFSTRLETLKLISTLGDFKKHCVLVEQVLLNNKEEVLDFERVAVESGFEGVMLRSVDGKYKYGRSTEKEGILLKLKRFADDEAEVLDSICRYINQNEAFVNELGHTARSTIKDNLVATDSLGALVCRTKDGILFNIGTGFTEEERMELWKNRDSLVGKLAKYKHFPVGALLAPRFPVFLGFRSPDDLESE